jgi:Lar family restriction alleviation protein
MSKIEFEAQVSVEPWRGKFVMMADVPSSIQPGRYKIALTSLDPLPCPFCGDVARVVFNAEGMWMVTCNCGATPFARESEAEAIAAWNKRMP